MFVRRLIFIAMLLMASSSVLAQEVKDTLTIFFRKDSAVIDRSFNDNGERMDVFFQKVAAHQGISDKVQITIQAVASASPDGTHSFNNSLSESREKAVIKLLKDRLHLSNIDLHTNSLSEDWDLILQYIEADPSVPSKERVMDAIHDFEDGHDYEDEIITELMKIDYARPYWYIYHNIFPKVRANRIEVIFDLSSLMEEVSVVDEEIDLPEMEFVALQKDTLALMPITTIEHHSALKLKTNALGWGLGHNNVAVEYAFADHFAVAVPFYYSGGFDYFKSTLKFRGIVVQPEFRYYFKPEYKGLYLGAHMGVGWYNFALNGDYRIQDHNGIRPAWGGGLGVGYAMQFKRAPKWGMEFALGAGVYDAKYDTFYNEDNGPIAQSGVRKVFVGIDNAAVSVTYRFDFKKRKEGGK